MARHHQDHKYFERFQEVLLASQEDLLRSYVLANKGQLVSKDQICEAVYPDVKNRAGISDHAIDQLIHRLRSKTKDKYQIVAHRAPGYKLV